MVVSLTSTESADTPEPPLDADRLRSEASDILSGREYSETSLPRPLKGLFDWIGEQLEPLVGPLDKILNSSSFQYPIGAVVLIGAAFLAVRAVRGRAKQDSVQRRRQRLIDTADPNILERKADEAERSGRFGVAVRLRFRAGLIHLELADRLSRTETTTGRDLRQQLDLPAFDRLADQFDFVTYGLSPSSSEDYQEALDNWKQVLKSAQPEPVQ